MPVPGTTMSRSARLESPLTLLFKAHQIRSTLYLVIVIDMFQMSQSISKAHSSKFECEV